MIRLILTFAMLLASASGCATHTPKPSMANDWRTGTDHTPYRSVPAAIQCDGCELY